jgi:integrase
MKNLAAAMESQKWAAGTTSEAKAGLIEFAWWLKKQGYKDSTIESITKLLKALVKRGADLLDPESVKEVIAKAEWSMGRKENAVDNYTLWLSFKGGSWNPPLYKRVHKLPFIPTEQEIDALIASCGPKTATFLQLLKETGVRAGEAWALKWTDLDVEAKAVRVTPEKGSEPRMLRISNKLLAMMSALSKREQLHFRRLSNTRLCKKLSEAKAQGCQKVWESTPTANQLPHFQTLEGNNGIR